MNKPQLNTVYLPSAVIKVIGTGGGGCNAVKHMVKKGISGVQFYCINTDVQALHSLGIDITCCRQIGTKITAGLGAGADPRKGEQAALEDKKQIAELIEGADMLFITAGMGGGTGTGSAPVIARLARELRILTIAIVTKPFEHENRTKVAEEGIRELAQHVDSIITIPNDKLLSVLGQDATLSAVFAEANDVLYGAAQGISDLIVRSGYMNVDFADVRTVMGTMGRAIIGTGIASGPDRATVAADRAINNHLTEDVWLGNAQGLLVNISASKSLSMGEFQRVNEFVKQNCGAENAQIVIGTVVDTSLGDDIKVTVVVTGVSDSSRVQGIGTARQNDIKPGLPGRPEPGLTSIPRKDHGNADGSPAYVDLGKFLAASKRKQHEDLKG